MRNFFYLTLTLMLTALTLSAERISPETAISIANAESAMQYRGKPGILKKAGIRFSKVAVTADAYYVVTTDTEKGFAIVASDDALPDPVAAYSTDRSFPADAKNLPPQLKAWLHDYSAIVKAAAEGRLTLKTSGTSLQGEAVAPLMKTKWNQSMPFNNLTPEFGSDHAPSGCVATAVTQVMKHFNFPKRGKGSVDAYPYYDSQKLDLSGHVYDWDNMLDVYECDWDYNTQTYVPSNFNETQAAAVATLMRDFGYAVKMSYGRESSGAQSSYVLPVLVRHFSYSPDARFSYRSQQSSEEWNGEIRKSLLSGSPVIYSGTDGKYGHEFVCDGIDENGLLHINWGWGGMSDGYFDMNILSPDNLGIGAGNGAYYKEQDALLFLKPGNEETDNTSYKAPLTLSNIACGWREEDGKLSSRSSVIMTARLDNSSGSEISSGDLKCFLSLYDMNDNLVYQNREQGKNNISLGISYYYPSQSFYFDGNIESADIPDGEYKVIPQYAYVNRNSDTLEETRDFARDREYVKLTVKNGDFYLDKPRPAGDPTIAITGATSNLLIAGTYKDFPVTVNVTSIINDYQPSAEFSYCLIHEDDDTGNIPDGDSNIWRYGSTTIYPGTTIGTIINVYGSELQKAGRYRMYFRQGETDITPQNAVWITAIPNPTEGFILQEPLGNIELPLSDYTYLSANILPYIPATNYEGGIQMWAYPENGTQEDAFMLFEANVSLKSDKSGWISGSAETMMEKPLGKYVVFIKYASGNEYKVVPGATNRGILDFSDTGIESGLLVLTKEAKIGDKDVANPGDILDIEYRLTCRKDINLSNPTISLLCKDPEHPEIYNIWLGNTEDFTISSTQIAKGEEFTIKGKLTVSEYVDCGGGKTYLVLPTIYDNKDGNNIYYTELRSYPYGESVKLRVEPLPAEHVDITVNSFETTDKFLPGDETAYISFKVEMTNKAESPLTHTRFNFYPVHVLSTEAENPDFENMPHGYCIPTNFPAGETISTYITMKGDMFPSYGVYRIYVTYEDMGEQIMLTGFDPIYVNIANSNYDVIIESASDNEYEKYLEPDVNFNIDLSLSCASGYFGPLELWAHPYFGGQEIKALEWNISVPSGSPENLQLEAPSDAFLNLPLGVFECYFKVRRDGKMVKAAGENNKLIYNIAGIKQGSPVLMLTDKATLSSGTTMPQGKEFEISLKAYSYGQISLDYSFSRIVLVDEETDEAINAEVGPLQGPEQINQGSFVTLKAKAKLPVDASAVGKMVKILPVLSMTNYNFCSLRTYPYSESMRVMQTDGSDVSELPSDESTIKLVGNILTVVNADYDSLLRIFSTDGALCREHRITADHMEFDLSSLPQGIYIISAMINGKAQALKFTR